MCKKRHFAAGHRVGLGFSAATCTSSAAPLWAGRPLADSHWAAQASSPSQCRRLSGSPQHGNALGSSGPALPFGLCSTVETPFCRLFRAQKSTRRVSWRPLLARAASFGLRIRFLVSPRLLVPPLGALASLRPSAIHSERPAQRKLPRCSLERLKRTSFRWDPRPHAASLAATACRTRSFLLGPHVPAHRSATGRNIASPTRFTLLPKFDHTPEFHTSSTTPHSAPAWSLLRPHAPTTGLA